MSGELIYDFGGAELTSITAYRYNKYIRGQDADFNNLDILYRDERRRVVQPLQDLHARNCGCRATRSATSSTGWSAAITPTRSCAVDDNLAYGADYARYANCLVAANFAAAAPAILAPGASPTCFNPAVAGGVRRSADHRLQRGRRRPAS